MEFYKEILDAFIEKGVRHLLVDSADENPEKLYNCLENAEFDASEP